MRYLAVGFSVLAILPSCASALLGDELIDNGSFEKGPAGFRSKYKYSPSGVLDELTYDFVKNPQHSHKDAASFGDHTTGSGYMMVINGGNAPDKALWTQAVKVRPDSEYAFSLWLASWYPKNPAELDIHVNGKSIGHAYASLQCGEWREFRGKWNSGSETSAVIEIFNLTTEFSGNDFALDDVSLKGPSAVEVKR
jgi:hypothetical protein